MLRGSIVALVTPMSEDGAVDYTALTRLLEFHIEAGTSGVVALGTTGEASTLTFDEQLQIIATVTKVVAGRIKVLIGNGGNNTALVVERTRIFDRFATDGYLNVVPYYSCPSQKGLIAHYRAVAAATDKPLYLYNVPSRTVADLLPQTVAELAQVENILGIKEATGDLSRLREIKALCGEQFYCYSGDDASALAFMAQGGDGVISATANVAAAQMAAMCHSVFAGDMAKAEAINRLLEPLHRQLFIEANPVPVKWALAHMELISSAQVRLPLLRLEPIHEDAVKEALDIAKLTL